MRRPRRLWGNEAGGISSRRLAIKFAASFNQLQPSGDQGRVFLPFSFFFCSFSPRGRGSEPDITRQYGRANEGCLHGLLHKWGRAVIGVTPGHHQPKHSVHIAFKRSMLDKRSFNLAIFHGEHLDKKAPHWSLTRSRHLIH